MHRGALQIHRHPRTSQRGRECEAKRREQLLQPIRGDDDRHPLPALVRPALADSDAPALTLLRHANELMAGRAAPGLQVGHDRREPVDE